MTKTEKMVREMNGVFKLIGQQELLIAQDAKPMTELEMLLSVKEEYKRRLLDQFPRYRSMTSEARIPDMFLQALRSRESELTGDSKQSPIDE